MKELARGLRDGDVEPVIEACNLMLFQLSAHLQRREEAYVMLHIGMPVVCNRNLGSGHPT